MGLELCPEIKQLTSQWELFFFAADKSMPNVEQRQGGANCFLRLCESFAWWVCMSNSDY